MFYCPRTQLPITKDDSVHHRSVNYLPALPSIIFAGLGQPSSGRQHHDNHGHAGRTAKTNKKSQTRNSQRTQHPNRRARKRNFNQIETRRGKEHENKNGLLKLIIKRN